MISREDNLKRAKAGMSEDRSDHWQERRHPFARREVAYSCLEGEPYRPSRDPAHDCQAMGCPRGGRFGEHVVTRVANA